MSADIHARLLDEAARRQCGPDGEVSTLTLGDKCSATGQAVEAAAATLARAIKGALPRSFLFEGRRYRLQVLGLVAELQIKDTAGDLLAHAVTEVSPK
jgi:hypothetical protein